MIRRNVPLGDEPQKWLLISQVEHARISAELATAWGGGKVVSVVCPRDSNDLHLQEIRRELLDAIRHHDDGWASWEASPGIDEQLLRPYSFTELPREQSLPLWRDSILRAATIGPLSGWVVAGHFRRLLTDSTDAHCEASRQWIGEVEKLQDEWLNDWRSINRPVHQAPLAEECLAWLRTFDWLSLWLCCCCPAVAGDSECEATTLDEGPLAGTPVSCSTESIESSSWGICVRPWPFQQPYLNIDALGYAVAAEPYTSAGALAKSRLPMRLRWRLISQ